MSPKVSPNFSEGFTPIEPGTYLCRIVSSELKYGKESNNPYINWKLETQPDKRTVYYSTPIQGKGAGMFKNFVHCAGDKNYSEGEYDTDQLNNQMVSMDLDVEQRTKADGKTANFFKVSEVYEPTMEQLEELNKESDLPF